ncbi:hypothetical protein [uncultured Psychroserpens sp.]|uniref:hypothetical protein n=1 Tax=uncultured Psychroserpens sp. TaxID=255436 RepID=UPI002635B981|nr:hypothetical protein [uncultured Psychroserpens sp.]
MSEVLENTISVIKQLDPDLPQYLDFKNLRKEGLEHIGNLAGKIWTDHNVHDPGITILEVLVYALIDLGYKTNLPFKDLIARENNQDKDDNFLTPLEILTVNPVTITDYRKLLLDIKGVRNAWLEPANQEVKLFIDQNASVLSCSYPRNSNNDNDNCVLDAKYEELFLNGLYKVYIEKGNDVANEDELKKEVRERLLQHRNLCEDFIDIKILEPINFGVCVDVEIRAGYDPKIIYSEIIKALKNSIQPDIRYYTLNQLLNKGKAIDAIFAGRPYSEKSFGFIDTDELEAYERRREIRLSDLYHSVLSIEGVRKIKKIHVNKEHKNEGEDPLPLNWTHDIGPCEVPVFSLENTCVDIYSEQGVLKIDKLKINKSFSFSKKFKLPSTSLNSEIPFGVYHEDINDYYSIQNDFPVVYGIGEDGLPESATLLRKTQALQLKSYLMFYDQILANYTSQLTNIRSLFSLKSEQNKTQDEKKTYFTQIPESITGIEDLLRFYDSNPTQQQSSVLAYPVLEDDAWEKALKQLENNPRTEFSIGNTCDTKNRLVDIFTFSSANIRSIYINQIIDSFYAKNYTIQILEDRFGCFFVLRPSLPNDVLIVGTKRYESASKAKIEANNVAFIAATNTSYNLVTNKSETNDPDQHYFGIIYHPISYIDLIQELTENKEEYISRRKQFLDHLLARFGEEFTEYALLQYKGKLSESERKEEMINNQSKYINEFAELSRNRGKAFNYLEQSWNTNNVSGFEKRISLLSGIHNYHRRNLCNFEVTECYRLLLNDPNGIPLFRANRSFETKEELHHAANKVLVQLRDSDSYNALEKSLNGFNASAISRVFSEKPKDENIIITKYHFNQQLLNSEGKEVGLSNNIASKNSAVKKKGDFLKIGIPQVLPNSSYSDKSRTYRLLSIDKDNHYLDATHLDKSLTISPIETWKWHINTKRPKKIVSEISFNSDEKAWEDVINSGTLDNYLVKHKTGYKWVFDIPNQQISFQGLNCYPDRNKAIAAWRKAKVLGSTIKNYTLEKVEKTHRLVLKNEKKKVIAVSGKLEKSKTDIIEQCTKVFSNRTVKPKYVKETDKLGFRIPINSDLTSLVSYCVYDSKKEALQEMNNAFKFGKTKKNYLQSGDEGNPEYNFLLRDAHNSFLALLPEHFEIASNRNNALKSILRFFKSNAAPVLIKKEPNTYVWSLFDNENVLLKSETEFSSKVRAQSDFDKIIASESLKSCYELCNEHIYKFDIKSTPSQFKFIYGNTNVHNELNPLFISEAFYDNEGDTKKAYTEFVKKLPQLLLKEPKGKPFQYRLYNRTSPVAIQYIKGRVKGDLNTARELTSYISKIYKDSKTPNQEFVRSQMAESQQKSYEWRFYKKNSPLAKSPYLCLRKEQTESIKTIICGIIPPVNLNKCPIKDIVVCPDKDKKKYHYQVCFNDNKDNEFLLTSYVGYATKKEAEDAWHKEWFEVINLARDPKQYMPGGKISPVEEYKKPDDKTCDDISFIAVIPDKRKTDKKEQELIDHYIQQANLYPLYKVEIDDEDEEQNREIQKCKDKYKYRVVVSDKELIDTDCTLKDENEYQGTLVWDSVDCFDSIDEVMHAYRHFYTLTGTHNNCRILCEKGKFYVGLVEVLAESSCDFISKEEAWDDAFPEDKNSCGDCIPKGVRAFIYAAEDDRNYIPVCDQDYWKFKVVSPNYFVVDHKCWYHSECERDHQKDKWIEEISKKINWDNYTTGLLFENDEIILDDHPLTHIDSSQSNKKPFKICCDMVHDIRECLKLCSKGLERDKQLVEIRKCLVEKFKTYICTEEEIENGICKDEKCTKHDKAIKLLDLFDSDIDQFHFLINHFPIHKTDKGYCYKIYLEEDDKGIKEEELQPCGCGSENSIEKNDACEEAHPFISSNCYSCCSEAFDAFKAFRELIELKKTFDFKSVSKTKYGPYSFQIIDTSKVLAYHPQQYKCLQEVEDAIQITKDCVDNVGMHLLEHILLRPKTTNECGHSIYTGDDVSLSNNVENCLLPICPDYCCDIEWQPDMNKEDPCSNNTEQNKIYYLPGTDPYSFWATIALPGWVKQFRTNESRQVFEKLLYKEVPALVGLNILWLSPSNMCKFEDEYKRWLEWIESSKKYLCEPEKLPICTLADCIKTLKTEDACPTKPGEKGDCDCEEKDWVNDDECCMPNETEGTIFWSCCEVSDPVIYSEISNFESVNVKEKSVSKRKTSKKTPKSKASIEKVKKSVSEERDVLTLVRKRKPKYLSDIKSLTNNDIQKTKSYERTLFFLKNIPTVKAHTQLVNFFKRYSLQKDNNIEGFFYLLKNATWHLLDNMALNQKGEIKKEDLDGLKTNLQILKQEGLSLKMLVKEWKIEEVKSLVNRKPLNQLKRILK